MAQDKPSVNELLETVREFIIELSDRLEGQDRYHALCASYLLEIVTRELSSDWHKRETADDKNLSVLLGEEVSQQQLLPALCKAIREGRFEDREAELFSVLLEHVEAKIAVTKPSYLARFK